MNLNTSWRQTASTLYKKPSDSKILGSVEIDVTDLETYIAKRRKEGVKITLTHFFMLATSRAIKKDVPELNTFVKRGTIYTFPTINPAVSVLGANGEMTSIVVKESDKLTFETSVEALNEEIKKSRKGVESGTMQLKEVVAKIPWPIRNWLYKILKTVFVDWGISIPFLGLKPHTFGSFMLSNIGTLGLDIGFPALFPIANVSFVMIMGGVQLKPWVVNGEVVPRRVITLGAALDHRVVDASHAGKLFKYLKFAVKNPEVFEKN
ncbi:2-oxo acid dehydrogenase subunit E2 [Lacihabitans sp. LS3-19]|uniref:2-oxo acid dehydrogenase subunit E2 n=1 Tax=Lacihabitans sp. LS3-19 TaxID=2487335 RepID=UPI0020CCE540|nr:2-oxo acid dehydrogenase subunit E2 [Lacihabitans sp. LS3-19]